MKTNFKTSFFPLFGYVLITAILLLTLLHYDLVFAKHVSTIAFIEDPQQYAGTYKNIMAPYSGSFSGGFIVNYNHHPLPIYYNQPYTPPRYGEVLIYGKLQSDGSVQAIAVHNYDYNFVLYALSFLAGLLVFVCFLKEWKITLGGIVSRKRRGVIRKRKGVGRKKR